MFLQLGEKLSPLPTLRDGCEPPCLCALLLCQELARGDCFALGSPVPTSRNSDPSLSEEGGP